MLTITCLRRPKRTERLSMTVFGRFRNPNARLIAGQLEMMTEVFEDPTS